MTTKYDDNFEQSNNCRDTNTFDPITPEIKAGFSNGSGPDDHRFNQCSPEDRVGNYCCTPASSQKLANGTTNQPEHNVQLCLVNSIAELQHNVSLFNQSVASHQELARDLLRQTTYWVYGSITGQFGPSKFVAFRNMNLELYQKARSGHWIGDRFDGHVTRKRIERVLGHRYSLNDGLADKLESWAVQVTGDTDALKSVDRSKWKFIVLLEFDAD